MAWKRVGMHKSFKLLLFREKMLREVQSCIGLCLRGRHIINMLVLFKVLSREQMLASTKPGWLVKWQSSVEVAGQEALCKLGWLVHLRRPWRITIYTWVQFSFTETCHQTSKHIQCEPYSSTWQLHCLRSSFDSTFQVHGSMQP